MTMGNVNYDILQRGLHGGNIFIICPTQLAKEVCRTDFLLSPFTRDNQRNRTVHD